MSYCIRRPSTRVNGAAGRRAGYNTNGEHEVVNTIVRESGEIVGAFGQPGHQAGEFTVLHTLAVDSRSNLYTAETVGGRRVQKFSFLGE